MGDFESIEQRLRRLESQVRNLNERLQRLEPAAPPEPAPAEDLSLRSQIQTILDEPAALPGKPAPPAPAPQPPPAPPQPIVLPAPPSEPAFTPAISAELRKFQEERRRQEEREAQAAPKPAAPKPIEPAMLHPEPAPPIPPRIEREPAQPSFAARLRELGLLPPERTGTIEAQIGMWWMTRLGMLLLVIGFVWFAVFVSRNTPPAVRLGEFIFASLAITAAGWKLERKMPKFGEVIFAGGLALLYFSAYGSYAIPPIKVIDDPVTGFVFQLAAVGLIGVLAIVRRAEPIAMLAEVFGFVACFFSVRAGLDLAALLTALVLAAGAIYFLLSRGWFQPLMVAIVGVWGIYQATFVLHWLGGGAAGYRDAMSYLAFVMTAMIVTDWVSVRLGKVPPRRPRLIMQTIGSAGGVALALMVTFMLYRNQLVTTYFAFGGLLLAAAVVYYLTDSGFFLMHSFFIKSMALVTLGVMTHYEGNARWVALAVQSIVLLGSAWRTRLKVTEGAMVIVWALSMLFMIRALVPIETSGADAVPLLLQPVGKMALGWLAASGLALGFYGRLFRRNSLCTVLALALGLGAMLIGFKLAGPQWVPLSLAAVALGLVLIAAAPRHWLPIGAAMLPLAASHTMLWTYEMPKAGGIGVAWCNEAAVVGLTFLVAMGLALAARRSERLRNRGDVRQALVVAHGLWMLALFAIPMATFALESWLAMGVGLAWVASGLALIPLVGMPMSAAVVPLVYTLVLFIAARLGNHGLLQPSHLDHLLYVAFAGALAHVLSTWRLHGPFRRRFDARAPIRALQAAHMAAAVLIGQVAMNHLFSGQGLMFVYGLAAIAVGAVAWFTDQPYATPGAAYYLACAHFMGYTHMRSALWPGVVASLITLLAAPALRRLPERLSRERLESIQWIAAASALALIDMLLLAQHRAGLGPYVTILWGVAALVLVAVGFLDRAKPLRLVGLIGLALCILRVFAVDIQSMFYRIAAFIILGVVLLAVGFVYNKFRDVIERIDQESTK